MAKVVHTTIDELVFPFQEYVLVVPGWYPTWQDPYPGDFNQRHVLAVSALVPQVVLYISKDLTGRLNAVETRYHQVNERLIEVICIYPSRLNSTYDLFYSNITFSTLLLRNLRHIRLRFGKPVLVHGYIVVRGGLGAMLVKRLWKIPAVLTENWTIYYPSDPGYLLHRNPIFRMVVKMVFRNIDRYLPVTNNLAAATTKLLGNLSFSVIPNVVDVHVFDQGPAESPSGVFTFVHVSTMSYQKNPEGLLNAFQKLVKQGAITRLLMVGPYPREVLDYARSLELQPGLVEFTGSVTYLQVAAFLKQSNALVLFSRYENLPCVVLEALCCGLPVISTDVGGIKEVINNCNGVMVPEADEDALQSAMAKMYNTYPAYDKNKIAEKSRQLFSYETVGTAIKAVYEELLHKRL